MHFRTAASASLDLEGIADRIDRIELRLGSAETLELPEASFDGLTLGYLLRYLDDPGATMRDLLRLVKPGAPFALLDFGEGDTIADATRTVDTQKVAVLAALAIADELHSSQREIGEREEMLKEQAERCLTLVERALKQTA